MTATTLADLQRTAAVASLNRIAVLVNNAQASQDVAFGKHVNFGNLLDDIEAILDANCHCGRENYTDDNDFTRFMCEPCSAVRCDATPCPPCPPLVENS